MLRKLLAQIHHNFGVIALGVVLCGSLAVNLRLAMTIRSMKTLHRAGVPIGAKIPTIPVLTSTGSAMDLRLDDGLVTVLYIMSPGCGWCKKNNNNIRTLAAARGSELRFIGLANTAANLQQYLQATPSQFPLYVVNPAKRPKQLDVSVTPQLVLVGPTGIVQKVWAGALDERSQAEVEKHFKVKLPGLS